MSTKTRQLALVGCLVAALAAGCGSDEEGAPIPEQQVADLEARLNEVERRFENGTAGACNDIQTDSLTGVQQVLDQLPDSVDADVRDALRESFERLFELSATQCEATEPEPEPEPEPETETETVPTETVPTETVPTETEEEKPKKEEKKNGNGNGNGNSGGGGAPAPGIGG